MSIKKMMLAAVMALAAIAFAAPAAQADVTLTDDPNGTGKEKLVQGAKVTATSINLETTVGEDGLVCELVSIHLEVVNPGPTELVLEEDEAGNSVTTQGCKTTGGFPVTITKATIGSLTIDTWGAGSAQATFVSDVYSPLDPNHQTLLQECHFAGQVDVQATTAETGQPDSDKIGVGPSKLDGTPLQQPHAPCATGKGVATIHGEFTLETPDPQNTPVTIDFDHTVG